MARAARVATLEELLQAHPDLLTSQHPAGQLRLRLEGIAQELSRWEAKLAKGLPATLKKGEFRRDGEGTVWQTTEKVKVGEDSVPAVRYGAPAHGTPAVHRRRGQPPGPQTGQPTMRGHHAGAKAGGRAGG